MSKILILTSELKDKKVNFVSLIKKNFRNKETQIILKRMANCKLEISEGKVELYVENQSVKDYDLVYLRGIAMKDIFSATTIAIAMETLNVNYFDTLYSRPGPHRSKLGSLTVLASNNLPVPQTIYFFDNSYEKHFEELSQKLGMPFIAKEMSQQRGKGVHLIKTALELENLPKANKEGSTYTYFFQKFIDKDHEYRLLTLKDTIGVWEEKVNKSNVDFRNNVALGAEEIFFDATKTPKEIKEVAVNSGKALGIQIGGVDIMTEKSSGKVYILEVNRGPGLTYDENISPEFKALATFLEKEAK